MKSKRSINFLPPIAGLLAGLAVFSAACTPQSKVEVRDEPDPLNVIMVSLDTLRADRLHSYGYERETSPGFDGLIDQAVTFDLAIAQAPHTRPSHLSIFQSRLPSQTHEDAAILAEIFAANDYTTAAFTGGGHVSARFGFGRGFSSYEEEPKGFKASFDRIEGWIQNAGDDPFFLFLHSYDIHLPYDPPKPYKTMFTAPDYDGPIWGAMTRDLAQRVRKRKAYTDHVGPVVVSEADRRQYSDLYDGGILYADQYLTRLVELLELQELRERTVVVIFSDHGEEFWDHGSVAHGHTLYQELIHVPLMFLVPGVEGRRIADEVALIDVAPTILDLLRIDQPDGFSGTSLAPAMRGGELGNRIEPVAEIARQRCLIRYPWKIILDLENDELVLFNLESDPHETTDVAAEQEQIAAILRERLLVVLSGSTDVDLDMDAFAEAVDDADLREQLRALGYIE